jgi:DNA helicase HerA-like ATPase
MTNAKGRFTVSKQWPLREATPEAKATTVQDLIANHTLIVGQSRSGKTNAARRIIEEVLIWTNSRVVILDPNADFRHLAQVDGRVEDKDFASRWSDVQEHLHVATPGGSAPWGIDWGKLSLNEMAAFLRINPKESFAEFRHLDRHFHFDQNHGGIKSLDEFLASEYFEVAVGEELERYRFLLEQLKKVQVWANNPDNDLDSLLTKNERGVVVDLSIDDEQVRTMIAARTLEALWRDGLNRRKEFLTKPDVKWPGTLVVIDEAHMFAPPDSQDSQRQLVSNRIKRFADQGKKLNLYILVVTQQPGKLHRDVLAECSNRIIMRVNDQYSLKVLEDIYGGISGRYDGALTFNPGEAFAEGSLLSDENPPPANPRAINFLFARTKEGGGTPPRDWAKPNAEKPEVASTESDSRSSPVQAACRVE